MRKPMWARRLNLKAHRFKKRWRRGSGAEDLWVTAVMKRSVASFLAEQHGSCIEVSGDLHGDRGWTEYVSTSFPDFDLCCPPPIADHYDVVICEQVLEHVEDPVTSVRTLRELAKPGGRLVISTPFLLRIHGHPGDYWRFTEQGLVKLIESAGLQVDEIHSWGNLWAARGNLWRWRPHRRWQPLRNNPEFPVVVWAFCSRA